MTGIPARPGEAAGSHRNILGNMDSREKKLYHQIHPFKLATDIGVTPIFLFFLWHHHIARALLVGFVPPIIVSGVMMIWPPNLEKLKNSRLGNYVSKYDPDYRGRSTPHSRPDGLGSVDP